MTELTKDQQIVWGRLKDTRVTSNFYWTETSSKHPANPIVGSVYYNIHKNKTFVYDGTKWLEY